MVGYPREIRREKISHFVGYTVSAQCPFSEVGGDVYGKSIRIELSNSTYSRQVIESGNG